MDALERFRKEFKNWVRALNRAKGFNASADEVLERLEDRIPETMLRQIGGAFVNGWLQNEPEANRGYFVRESYRKGPGGGQWMISKYAEPLSLVVMSSNATNVHLSRSPIIHAGIDIALNAKR